MNGNNGTFLQTGMLGQLQHNNISKMIEINVFETYQNLTLLKSISTTGREHIIKLSVDNYYTLQIHLILSILMITMLQNMC